MSTPRQFLEKSTFSRSALFGAATAVALYVVGCLEASIMMAMALPGIYLGFALIAGSWVELVEESITMFLLIGVYLYCMHNVNESVYLAPASVALHGFVDLLHHAQLYPSEGHVHACWPRYPLFCCIFDFSFGALLAGMLYLFGA